MVLLPKGGGQYKKYYDISYYFLSEMSSCNANKDLLCGSQELLKAMKTGLKPTWVSMENYQLGV